MVEYFCDNEIQNFITDTYFFLKFDEIKEVKEIVSREIKIDSKLTNEDSIFLLNRKNDIIKKMGRERLNLSRPCICINSNSKYSIFLRCNWRLRRFYNWSFCHNRSSNRSMQLFFLSTKLSTTSEAERILKIILFVTICISFQSL